jgi:hypothetical protein
VVAKKMKISSCNLNYLAHSIEVIVLLVLILLTPILPKCNI